LRQRILACVVLALVPVASVWADTLIWGNNATNGNVTLEEFDATTGAVVQQFLAPNLTARADNGRGIAAAADGTIYYTTADSGNVYKTNGTTHADLGVAFVCVPCAGSISTITFDGTNLFITPYTTSNQAFEYTTSGTLLQSINGPFGSGRDGFEIITRNSETEIIGNRGDAEDPYDLYHIVGNNAVLVQSAFITTNFQGTGITYDGTDFYVSNIFNNALDVYDNNGNFVRQVTLGLPLPPTSDGRLLEDLSALGNTSGNPPPSVPEPSAYILLGTVVALTVGLTRRRNRAEL